MVEIPEKINLTEYYLDRNIAEGRGKKIAIYYGDQKITYSEIHELTNKVGNLLKNLGIEPEDRVLIALNDSPEFVATWFGVIKIGAVATDVYTYLQPKDYEYFLNYTRAKIAIVDQMILPKFQEIEHRAFYLKNLIVVGKRIKGYLFFDELVEKQSYHLKAADTSRDDIALWKFTSGTTGQPKGVALTHRNSIYNFLCYGKQILNYDQNDITLSVPKLFFGYARDAGVVYAFGSGAATALFPERSTPEKIFEMIEKYRPTVLINVPTMINAMLQVPHAKEKYDLSCLKFCTSAGEALPEELYHRWKNTFGVEILDCIGSAELYHCYISNKLGEVMPGSVGKLVPGYEAKILNEKGEEVPEGETGTLWIKGESAGLCYWNDYEKTRKTFIGEWVNTGDLFKRDKNGFFWFMGRAGDLLKVGGIFVAPLEIENCLLQHPLILECAVVGVKDENNLTVPKAFIVLKEGVSASDALIEEIKSFVKSRLAPYKYPRMVAFIKELPKDDRGKVRKKLLV